MPRNGKPRKGAPQTFLGQGTDLVPAQGHREAVLCSEEGPDRGRWQCHELR